MPFFIVFVNLVSLRFMCLLDWTIDRLSAVSSKIIGYLSGITWNQLLVAYFFAYFKPGESLNCHDILFLICCPAHLREEVKQEHERKGIRDSVGSSKGKMMPDHDKAFVSVSGGIRPACSEDMKDFYLRLVLHSNISRGITEQNIYICFVITKTQFREADHPHRMHCACIRSGRGFIVLVSCLLIVRILVSSFKWCRSSS